MRCRSFGGVLIVAVALMALRAGPLAGQTTTEPTIQLDGIRSRLASEDFAVREAAQAELGKIPQTDMEILRQAAGREREPEVKARLEQRVAEMELYALIHPPAISVDVKNATMGEVTAALNKALGSDYVQITSTPQDRATLTANEKPFWEVIRDLDLQNPLAFGTSTTISAAGTKTMLRLGKAGAGAAPHTLFVVDTFGLLAQSSGQRATGNWALRLTVFTDPRVKVAQYSAGLRIDKLIDQDGRNLIPLLVNPSTSVSSLARPTISFTSTATLSAAPGVTGIKQLRGSVVMTLLESEKTIKVDLLKEKQEPIDTPRGKVTVEKGANGAFVVKIVPEPQAAAGAEPAPLVSTVSAANRGMMTVRVMDENGTYFRMMTTTGTEISIAAGAAGAQQPASIEIIMTDKTRDYVLPVDLKDIDLGPAPAAVQPAQGK